MNVHKVRPLTTKGKSLSVEDFAHFVAVDWSMKTMAVAHMGRQRKEPRVFEDSSNLTALKAYLRSLRGRTILTIEETTTAHWLYVELRECVDRIVVCNPRHNRLLCDGPKTDKIDASKLCTLLRNGLLKEVYHTNDELYDLRLLVSAYGDLVQAGVRMLNQRAALDRGHRDESRHAAFIVTPLSKGIELYE